MAKKRKTPPGPRTPFGEVGEEPRPTAYRRTEPRVRAVDVGPVFRDTDELDLGEVHPDFAHEPGEDTKPRAQGSVVVDDSLLDLGSLRTSPAAVTPSGGFAAPRLEDESTVERRLTPTLLKIFARRRQQIRLSLDQLSRLSGIGLPTLEMLESDRPGRSITYDQVVVLSRVLGIGIDQLPGLRPRETRPHLGVALAELERTLLGAPLLRFEGQHGERYGGDVERATASKAFTVRIEDASLEPVLARGSLLGFMSGIRPRPNGVLLLRHRRSALLALRRHQPPSYEGLVAWQPAYVVGGEWHVVGSLEVSLPPR